MNWQALQDRTNTTVLGVFGETVVLAGVSVVADYCDAYTTGDVGTDGMACSSPQLTMATSDVPALPVGKTATVRGIDYVVTAHEPDGYGLSRITLMASA